MPNSRIFSDSKLLFKSHIHLAVPSPWIWGNLLGFDHGERQKYCFGTETSLFHRDCGSHQEPVVFKMFFFPKGKSEINQRERQALIFSLRHLPEPLFQLQNCPNLWQKNKKNNKKKRINLPADPAAHLLWGFYGFNLFRSLTIVGANHPQCSTLPENQEGWGRGEVLPKGK